MSNFEPFLPLLCKLAVTPLVELGDFTPEDLMAVEGALLCFDEAGLVILKDVDASMDVLAELTDAGRGMVTLASGPVAFGATDTPGSRAGAAMWLWLISHGGNGSHSFRPWGRNGTLAHVLVCGLDLGKSGEVRDDSWTEFVNSFIGQGPDRIVGVSGNATCLCGKVTAERFSAEVQSITALILAVTG